MHDIETVTLRTHHANLHCLSPARLITQPANTAMRTVRLCLGRIGTTKTLLSFFSALFLSPVQRWGHIKHYNGDKTNTSLRCTCWSTIPWGQEKQLPGREWGQKNTVQLKLGTKETPSAHCFCCPHFPTDCVFICPQVSSYSVFFVPTVVGDKKKNNLVNNDQMHGDKKNTEWGQSKHYAH